MTKAEAEELKPWSVYMVNEDKEKSFESFIGSITTDIDPRIEVLDELHRFTTLMEDFDPTIPGATKAYCTAINEVQDKINELRTKLQEQSMSEELKPCLCGKSCNLAIGKERHAIDYTAYWVESECGWRSADCSTKEQAIKAWNTRHEPTTQQVIDRLHQRLSEPHKDHEDALDKVFDELNRIGSEIEGGVV